MPVGGPGPEQLRLLSARLRAAGPQGQGLRRELYRAINEAAKPLAAEVKDPAHLRVYMPNRYAGVLAADLAVTAVKRGGASPSVKIQAKGRAHRRKVVKVDAGVLVHPLFGDRKHWYSQVKRMEPGFFTEPMVAAAPGIRDDVLAAMHDVGQRITGG
jgi:hypothetical protein